MFKLNQSKTYWTPVNVEIPSDGGKFEKSTFDACFNRLAKDELIDLQTRLQNKEISDLDVARKVLTDWRKIQDESGVDIPFTDSTLNRIDQEVVQFMPALINTYFSTIVRVREKNS